VPFLFVDVLIFAPFHMFLLSYPIVFKLDSVVHPDDRTPAYGLSDMDYILSLLSPPVLITRAGFDS